MVIPSVRYRLPSPIEGTSQPTSIKEDLFALGSTIYFIVTSHEPYTDLSEDEVQERYRNRVFPNVADIPFSKTITLCWKQEADSAKKVLELLQCPLEGSI